MPYSPNDTELHWPDPKHRETFGVSLDIGPMWHFYRGDGPTIGAAVHAGHEVRPELVPYLALDEHDRLREEDPYADYWTQACHSQILTERTRFEVDLNRPRDEAVYATPADAWGLKIWEKPLTPGVIQYALAEYDAFYEQLQMILEDFVDAYGGFVLFDLHSYNHRRNGPGAPPADPEQNPEINLGTGSMDRDHWAPVVDAFISTLRHYDFFGRRLDVRENVAFKGRELGRFVHTKFPKTGCALSIEVKKFFMDEWSGEADYDQVAALLDAFRNTIGPVTEALNSL